MEEKSTLRSFFEWILVIILAIAVALGIRHFILSTTVVQGNSMNPTIESGDKIFVNRLKVRIGELNYEDIVEIHAPDREGVDYIKRIVGKPGDTIEIKNDNVYRNGEKLMEDYTSTNKTLVPGKDSVWQLDEDEYMVLGDNRLPGESNDSRLFGPVKKDRIVGVAFFRFLPLSKMGNV
ncbi:MAG: signal peptidase I [Finegoldia sp.]|nr:signal peptidase I [Finegoldia sp.]